MASQMHKSGWEVHVFTCLPSYPYASVFETYSQGQPKAKEMFEGCHVYRYSVKPAHGKKFLSRFRNVLGMALWPWQSRKRLASLNPDLVLVQSPPPSLAYTVAFLCKTLHLNLVINVSDLWQEVIQQLNLPFRPLIKKIITHLEGALFTKNTSFTVQSTEIQNYIQKANPKAEVFLYRNGVQQVFRLVQEDRRPNKKTESNILQVLYVGLLGMAQGLKELCEAVDFGASGAFLNIYGEGLEREVIQQMARVRTDMAWNESVPHKQVPELMYTHDVLLVPLRAYLYGTVPSKIYEGIAVGLPIVLMGAGESANLVQKYQAGWVIEPHNYEQLAELLAQLSLQKQQKALQLQPTAWPKELDAEHNTQLLIEWLHALKKPKPQTPVT